MHEGGLKVYTTLTCRSAESREPGPVLDGLAAYERRHGWKGHLENVVANGVVLEKYFHPDWDDEPEVNGYVHALVTSAGTGIATLKFGRYTAAPLDNPMLPGLPAHGCPTILKTRDICYVRILALGTNWRRTRQFGARLALLYICYY